MGIKSIWITLEKCCQEPKESERFKSPLKAVMTSAHPIFPHSALLKSQLLQIFPKKRVCLTHVIFLSRLQYKFSPVCRLKALLSAIHPHSIHRGHRKWNYELKDRIYCCLFSKSFLWLQPLKNGREYITLAFAIALQSIIHLIVCGSWKCLGVWASLDLREKKIENKRVKTFAFHHILLSRNIKSKHLLTVKWQFSLILSGFSL